MSDALIEAVAKAIYDRDFNTADDPSVTPWAELLQFRSQAAVREYRLCARAALAAIEAQGFRVVPVEPTPEMIKALNEYAVCAGYIPEGYAAMLSAAPKLTETP